MPHWLKFMVALICLCEGHVQETRKEIFPQAIDSEAAGLICLFISISLCNSIFKYKFAIRGQIPQPIEFMLCCFIAHFIAVENDVYHLEVPPEYFLWEDGLSGCCKASRDVLVICDTSAVLPGMRERGVFTTKTENVERKTFSLLDFPRTYEFNSLAIF